MVYDSDLNEIEHCLFIVRECGIQHARGIVDRDAPDLIAEVRRLRAENATLRARLRPYLDLEAWQGMNGERDE